jgi:hypothetical protein
MLSNDGRYATIQIRKVREQKAAYPLNGGANPPDERKEGLPMVTYAELFQFCTLMVALVGLCYTIFRGKK